MQHENHMADYRASGKELRRSPKGLIAALLALALCAGAGFGIYRIRQGITEIERKPQEQSSEAELSLPEVSTVEETEDRIIYQYEAVFASEMHSGPLMNVNRYYSTGDITEGLKKVYDLKNSFYGLRDVSLELYEEPILALNAMAEAMKNDLGYAPFLINTAYRTAKEQDKLFDEALKQQGTHGAAETMPMAGQSDYQTGYSIGITLTRNGSYYELSGENGTAEREWMETNAAKYGYILRYPEGKDAETGFPYDATHYRYVGVPHALYMQANGLCLDEYLELLRREHTYGGTHLSIPDENGNRCEVCYVPVSEEAGTVELPVPIDYPYSYSGDNMGGFIVTVRTGLPMNGN